MRTSDSLTIVCSLGSDWLREWREFFSTNHREELSKKTKAIPDVFRHSVENCSIVLKITDWKQIGV